MKLYITFILSLFISSSAFSKDPQTVSDEAWAQTQNYTSVILNNIRLAKGHADICFEAKRKIISNPSLYDVVFIKKEWDEVTAELRAGLFCRGCHRSRKEYEQVNGLGSFGPHAAQNGGTEPATQADYDRVNALYTPRLNRAHETEAAYRINGDERNSKVFEATTMIQILFNSFQTAYDFQFKVYYPFRFSAVETFNSYYGILVLKNNLVVQTSPEDQNYERYKNDLYGTVDVIESSLVDLNGKRKLYMDKAEDKRVRFLKYIQNLRDEGSLIKDDESSNPSTWYLLALLEYKGPDLSNYLQLRSRETIDRFYKNEKSDLYKDIKSRR
jgi:hypothetical protein